MDWEWWAFKEGAEAQIESQQKAAHDATSHEGV